MSSIYYSYRLSKVLKCNCDAYRYPHAWGFGDCSQSIIDNPPVFAPPKRGLSGKLQKILEAYSGSDNELLQDLIDSLTICND
jgi:hypothetical protein